MRHACTGSRVDTMHTPVCSCSVFAVTKKGVAFKNSPTPEPEPENEEIGALGYGIVAAGAVSNPIVLWSAYTLATTGQAAALYTGSTPALLRALWQGMAQEMRSRTAKHGQTKRREPGVHGGSHIACLAGTLLHSASVTLTATWTRGLQALVSLRALAVLWALQVREAAAIRAMAMALAAHGVGHQVCRPLHQQWLCQQCLWRRTFRYQN